MKKRIKKYIKHFFKKDDDKLSVLRAKGVKILPGSFIGEYTKIGFGTRIDGPAFIASSKVAPVKIGKYCAIAHNLRIRPVNHYTGFVNLQVGFQNKYKFAELASTKGPVIIGNNVWIGDNVILLSGVEIGNGAVVGAGSVVSKNVPAFSIAVGNPAKVIKKRFSDSIVCQLSEIEWWNWSEEKIFRNRSFFETDFSKHFEFNIKDVIVD